ncbi:MAG TPA: hypothetical protein VJP80_05310 [Candidatus Saccharimonadales bacterium]|nr:hypothetical protein [Candidatus Saccharimonadales bacterium]
MNFKTYLEANARKLDQRLYEYLFESAGVQPVFDELSKYQNSDGGFGYSLEPDMRLPDSSALATTVALQYLAKVNALDNEPAQKAVRYLMETYDNERQCWVNIPPKADEYPRAPWWNYADVLSWAGWGNPSAEILGYLLENKDIVNDLQFLDRISKQAVDRLCAITEPEQHEVKCYVRLYERAGKELRTKLYDKIAAHIKALAKTNLKEWEGYVATPLTFVDSPGSPFADLFDKQTLTDNANFIKDKIVDGNHWEPAWQWGRFEDEWPEAKKDWSGKLTVENLLLLKAFEIKLDA